MSSFSRIAVCSPISATGKRITITKPLSASATDDTAYLSEALNIDTTQLNKCAYVAIALPNSNNTGEEVIICTKANYDSSAKTMSSCTRGLIGYGTGLTSDATQIGEHYAGTQITVPVLVQNMVQIQDAIEGDVTMNPTIGTMAWDTSVTDSALTMPIYADATARDAAITTPVEGMKVKLTSEGVISSYIGSTWVNEGTDTTPNGSTTVAGKYEAATAAERAAATATGGTGAILIPTNDALVKTSSGAGDENKIPILDSSGALATGFMPANVQEADTFFGATDITGAEAETLTDGSNADAEHRHGIVSATTVTVGSTTTETALFSQTIPANMLGTAGAIIVDLMVSDYNAVSRDLTIRLKYGSTTVATFTLSDTSASTGYSGYIKAKLFADGSTSSQKGAVQLTLTKEQTLTTSSAGTAIQTGVGTATEDSTGALTLSVTAQWNATGTQGITVYGGDLRYI